MAARMQRRVLVRVREEEERRPEADRRRQIGALYAQDAPARTPRRRSTSAATARRRTTLLEARRRRLGEVGLGRGGRAAAWRSRSRTGSSRRLGVRRSASVSSEEGERCEAAAGGRRCRARGAAPCGGACGPSGSRSMSMAQPCRQATRPTPRSSLPTRSTRSEPCADAAASCRAAAPCGAGWACASRPPPRAPTRRTRRTAPRPRALRAPRPRCAPRPPGPAAPPRAPACPPTCAAAPRACSSSRARSPTPRPRPRRPSPPRLRDAPRPRPRPTSTAPAAGAATRGTRAAAASASGLRRPRRGTTGASASPSGSARRRAPRGAQSARCASARAVRAGALA